MRIVVAGLGYVGSVSAAGFAQYGHEVVGVDTNAEKVSALSCGTPPVYEPRLADLLGGAISAGLLTATTDLGTALKGAELVLICVGTPSREDGTLDTGHIRDIVLEVGRVARDPALRASSEANRIAIVVRSTLLPGVSETEIVPSLLEGMGLQALPEWIGYGVQPEFLREGSAVADFFEPAKTVIGSELGWLSERLLALNKPLPGPKFVMTLAEAELAKYLDNAFHALKVAFANEMGRLALVSGVDPNQVFQPFLSDYKLNLSARYLRPGPPFGGSCLPKDVRALIGMARARGANVPLLSGVLQSNRAHADALRDSVLACSGDRVVLLGLAFKSHTDDLRESPFVELARGLAAAGRSVTCYDATIASTRLFGVNRRLFDELFETKGGRIRWTSEQPAPSSDSVYVLCTDHPQHTAVTSRLPVGYGKIIDLTGQYRERQQAMSPARRPGSR